MLLDVPLGGHSHAGRLDGHGHAMMIAPTQPHVGWNGRVDPTISTAAMLLENDCAPDENAPCTMSHAQPHATSTPTNESRKVTRTNTSAFVFMNITRRGFTVSDVMMD